MTHMVPKNRINLLQNGEAYFPALETPLERAMHEIYLETRDYRVVLDRS